MKYVLFLGGRVGYEALKLLCGRVSVLQVFLEREHAHEHTAYSRDIEQLCAQHSIPLSTSLREESVLKLTRDVRPDYLMCFGYRRMIPETVMACAGIACIGSHFAPLPRYRGFAPLNWVLINGEKKTAVNIFFLADEVDAGDIIAQEWVDILETDDINTLTEKCVDAFSPALEKALTELESGTPRGIAQDHSKATFTCSRNPGDGRIDWSRTSREIRNLVRALTYPMPGAFTTYEGRRLYIWACDVVEERPYDGRVCGKVVAVDRVQNAIKVLTGDGSLWVTKSSTDAANPERNDITFGSVRVTLGQPQEGP